MQKDGSEKRPDISKDGTVTDERGTKFTEGSATKENGEGETYGPNHPNPPIVVTFIRTEAKK